MAREFFKDLPNTTTPLRASRMNALLDGDEAMGNILVDTIHTKNLFNINGDINVYADDGSLVSFNTVNNNILTTNANTYNNYSAGQKLTGLNGKTITFSAKCVSNGSGQGGQIAIYDNYIAKASKIITNGNVDAITYTCTTDNIIVGFNTELGTGAQFTDIQVELGDTATPWAEYQYLSSKQIVFDYYTSNVISSGGLDDFKNYIPTVAPNGMSLWNIGFSGASYAAICMKANSSYLSFILFSYDMTATQYKKYGNAWTETQL